ncbi:MAG: site-specific integrase [Lachnospiraceae bacterium]|nr:site-specific integrase [Lachnospiraceae bacterium]
MDATLKQALDLFIFDRETYCAPRTLGYYKKNLGFFTEFLSEQSITANSPLSDIPSNVLTLYVHHLRDRVRFAHHPFAKMDDTVHIKNTTIRTYCRAVKAFLNFSNMELDTTFKINVKMPKDDSDEKVPLYATEVYQIDMLFNIKSETGIRNWCIFHLMLDAGLRSEEVLKLQISDILFDKNIIKIVDSKGNKSRVVLLAPRLKKNLYTYLFVYRGYTNSTTYENQPIFSKLRGGGTLNYNCIKQLFSRIKKKTDIERLTPHLLRHTFATSYIMGGGNIESLRLLLGHYDYSVTRTYLHLANTYTLMHADIYHLDPVFFRVMY